MDLFTNYLCSDYDKTVLVIPKPGADTSVGAQISKVLEPFELEVWGLILGLITLTALLSVWFTRYGRGFTQVKRKERMKKGAYARVALDECLQKGMVRRLSVNTYELFIEKAIFRIA